MQHIRNNQCFLINYLFYTFLLKPLTVKCTETLKLPFYLEEGKASSVIYDKEYDSSTYSNLITLHPC